MVTRQNSARNDSYTPNMTLNVGGETDAPPGDENEDEKRSKE